jgi:hypothetical protein
VDETRERDAEANELPDVGRGRGAVWIVAAIGAALVGLGVCVWWLLRSYAEAIGRML